MTNWEADSKESAVETSNFGGFRFKDFVAHRTVGFYIFLKGLNVEYLQSVFYIHLHKGRLKGRLEGDLSRK